MAIDLSCADCCKPMKRTKDSLPQGRARCHHCRRLTWGLPPGRTVREMKAAQAQAGRSRLAHCRRCDAPVPTGRRSYCSPQCGNQNRQSTRRLTTAERGYGHAHQMLRALLLEQAYGEDCHLCGAAMLPHQELHLDHAPDRTGYRGMAHAWCNSLDGLQRAREAQRRKRLGVSA